MPLGNLRRRNQKIIRKPLSIPLQINLLPEPQRLRTSPLPPHYARLRTALEQAGSPIGPNDALIAAHALALGCTLVTADAEFDRVPGLRVENWALN